MNFFYVNDVYSNNNAVIKCSMKNDLNNFDITFAKRHENYEIEQK